MNTATPTKSATAIRQHIARLENQLAAAVDTVDMYQAMLAIADDYANTYEVERLQRCVAEHMLDADDTMEQIDGLRDRLAEIGK